jgi:hypothetical protein
MLQSQDPEKLIPIPHQGETNGLLSPALSSRGGEGEAAPAQLDQSQLERELELKR